MYVSNTQNSINLIENGLIGYTIAARNILHPLFFCSHLQQSRNYIFAISFKVFFTKPTGVGGITVSGLTVGPGSGCDSGDPALDSSGITAGGSGNRGGISQRGAVPSYTSDPYR